MNLLDKAIAILSPEAGLARARARSQIRAYEAVKTGEVRGRGFGRRASSANGDLDGALTPLRDRARWLVQNNGLVARIVDVLTSHVVGTGIMPQWNTGSDGLDQRLSVLWQDWQRQGDAARVLTFEAMQALAMRGIIEGGETITRLVDRPASDGAVPLRLQLMEGDHIDESRDGTLEGRRVRLGVALGEWDERIGFYLHRTHPSEPRPTLRDWQSSFVERDRLMHVFRPLRAGQVRGVPWFAPMILDAKAYGDLLAATVTKARIEASYTAFIRTEGAGDPIHTTTTADGEKVTAIEPGMQVRLNPGEDISFPASTPAQSFRDVSVKLLQAMAAGAGCTYDQMTGDLSQANYSSLRAGKIEFRRLVEQIQWHVLEPMLLEPVASRFIERAILRGTLKPRRNGYGRTWVMPAVEPIDPKKDLEADIAAVRAGRMSPQEFILGWGRDWRKVVREHAEFQSFCAENNVVFTTNPAISTENPAQAAVVSPSNTDEAAPAADDATD